MHRLYRKYRSQNSATTAKGHVRIETGYRSEASRAISFGSSVLENGKISLAYESRPIAGREPVTTAYLGIHTMEPRRCHRPDAPNDDDQDNHASGAQLATNYNIEVHVDSHLLKTLEEPTKMVDP